MWMLQAREQWVKDNGLFMDFGRIKVQNGFAVVERQFDKQYLVKAGFRDITPDIMKGIQPKDPKNILILRAGGFGDVLMALPVIEALKRKYPEVPIDVCIDAGHYEVIKGHPAIRHCIHTFPQYIGIELEKYDMVIDFSTIIPGNPQAEFRNAYDLHFEWADLPMPTKDEAFVSTFELDTAAEDAIIEALPKYGVDPAKDWIIINSMATSSPRQYPFTHSRNIAIALANTYPDKQILFCGPQPPQLRYTQVYKCVECGKQDFVNLVDPPKDINGPDCPSDYTGYVKCSRCGDRIRVYPAGQVGKPRENCISWFEYPENVKFIDTSIKEFMHIIDLAQLVISTDSAPLHIAGMLKTPALGIFSSFDGGTRLSHFKHVNWIQGEYRCAPCFLHSQYCPTAQRDGNIFPNCLEAIKPAIVIERACRMIDLMDADDYAGLAELPRPKSVKPKRPEACPVCGSAKSELRCRKGKFFYYTCAECDALYVSPRPTAEEVKEIYADTSYSNVFRKYEYCANNAKQVMAELTCKLEEPGFYIPCYGPAKYKVLEVGCNIGLFGLEALKKSWSYYGVDISEDAIKTARKAYKEQFIDAKENAEYSIFTYADITRKEVYEYYKDSLGGNFDVIIIHQTLEHIVDPIGFLTLLKGLLAPSGKFSIIMPDIGQWQGDAEWPHINTHHTGEHCILYSQNTVEALANRCGLKVDSATTLPASHDFWVILKGE